eukprot:5919363-Pleurochrysis_carterae.AAC.1
MLRSPRVSCAHACSYRKRHGCGTCASEGTDRSARARTRACVRQRVNARVRKCVQACVDVCERVCTLESARARASARANVRARNCGLMHARIHRCAVRECVRAHHVLVRIVFDVASLVPT